jgi:hypothetical protein
MILIFSPQMKEMYKKFGKVITLDFTFNIIKEKPAELLGNR